MNLYLPDIQVLCRKHFVSRLWVFGSVLRTDFRKDSDIDFLYELDHKTLSPAQSNHHFFAFIDEMKTLLGHKVDMIWYGGIKNPYFLEEVNETKILLYDQRQQKIFV
ncbi:MAG: nucleotidyltransferase domain-containing protein [Bacteroidia bacterium]|nr:nucleotidyltransferase domain-containing protein [Bacteroidia bacterium]